MAVVSAKTLLLTLQVIISLFTALQVVSLHRLREEFGDSMLDDTRLLLVVVSTACVMLGIFLQFSDITQILEKVPIHKIKIDWEMAIPFLALLNTYMIILLEVVEARHYLSVTFCSFGFALDIIGLFLIIQHYWASISRSIVGSLQISLAIVQFALSLVELAYINSHSFITPALSFLYSFYIVLMNVYVLVINA